MVDVRGAMDDADEWGEDEEDRYDGSDENEVLVVLIWFDCCCSVTMCGTAVVDSIFAFPQPL